MSTATEDQYIRSVQGIPFSGPQVKGEEGGLCNVTDCQKPGAIFFNHSTRKFYCPECAQKINFANHEDAMRMFRHELCTAPNWLLCVVGEKGDVLEIYVTGEAYTERQATRMWRRGDTLSSRSISGEGDHFYDSISPEENVLSIERTGEDPHSRQF